MLSISLIKILYRHLRSLNGIRRSTWHLPTLNDGNQHIGHLVNSPLGFTDLAQLHPNAPTKLLRNGHRIGLNLLDQIGTIELRLGGSFKARALNLLKGRSKPRGKPFWAWGWNGLSLRCNGLYGLSFLWAHPTFDLSGNACLRGS